MTTNKLPNPKVGDQIYVPSSMSFDRGESDISGGLATISRLEEYFGNTFVSIEECPAHSWNYAILLEQQDALKKEFGKKTARPDPDYGPNTKKKITQLAIERIDTNLQALTDVAASIYTSPEIFDEADKQAIKAIKLGLIRFQNKLLPKSKQKT